MPNVLDTEETLTEIQQSATELGYDTYAQSDAYEEEQLAWEKPLDIFIRTHPYIYADALLG